ncbi:hypothetical protein NEUTE2DRAFT_51437 [Neurospora tetrasperma FGSC 2509]|nr:hypothetical protein NEUTE2DRAFT_51437 [Neurospora tetrasperma FGSC 2509]
MIKHEAGLDNKNVAIVFYEGNAPADQSEEANRVLPLTQRHVQTNSVSIEDSGTDQWPWP